MITPTNRTARILLLDPQQTERRSLSLAFTRDPYQMIETNTLDSAFEALRADDIHLFVIRHTDALPEPAELVRRARRIDPAVEIIAVLPEAASADVAAVLAAGAFDCLPALPSTEEMMVRSRRALEHRSLKLHTTAAREEIAMSYSFDNMVGISRTAGEIRDTMARLAPTDIPVLICGAPGTGKDLCAHILHHHSERRDHALVTVDCATPEPVLSIELFGGDTPGLLEQADNGTLFLKNIESMPSDVQERFLQFLKNPTYATDGRQASVRLLASTTETADELDASDRVRTDLLIRLNTFIINLPTLRERAEDIEILAEYFLRRISAESERPTLQVTRSAADRLIRYSWPGNIRELENTLRRAAALTSADTLDSDSIVFVSGGVSVTSSPPPKDERAASAGHRRLADNQRDLIERALIDNNWNFTKTAQELGIGRTTLWRKVKKYNLKSESVTS